MTFAPYEDARRLHALRHPDSRPSGLAIMVTGLFSHGIRLLACQRLMHRYECPRPRALHRLLPFLAAKVLVVLARRYVMIAGKGEFAAQMPVEPGVVFADGGHLVVGSRALGTGSYIGAHTTVGMNLTPDLRPWIGRNVWIGEHCIVYGDIRIGDGATILPRTVLTRSVPPGAVAEGNPARIRIDEPDHRALRLRAFGFAGPAAAPTPAPMPATVPEGA